MKFLVSESRKPKTYDDVVAGELFRFVGGFKSMDVFLKTIGGCVCLNTGIYYGVNSGAMEEMMKSEIRKYRVKGVVELEEIY